MQANLGPRDQEQQGAMYPRIQRLLKRSSREVWKALHNNLIITRHTVVGLWPRSTLQLKTLQWHQARAVQDGNSLKGACQRRFSREEEEMIWPLASVKELQRALFNMRILCFNSFYSNSKRWMLLQVKGESIQWTAVLSRRIFLSYRLIIITLKHREAVYHLLHHRKFWYKI